MRIHHIGYAVKNIVNAISAFKALGYELASTVTVDMARNVRICFMRINSTLVELVAPDNKESPINKILSSGSGMPYHFCYEVDNISETIDRLSRAGFALFVQPEPAPAIDNRNVAFLYNTAIGIIEILEGNKQGETNG